MANISKDIQCAGFDTRPPMLDMTDFASWQQRNQLYCRGKKNRVNILKSIDEGPFRMRTLRETLTEGTKGAPHLGLERPRVYSNLTTKEKERMQLNLKFVNNMLHEWGKFVTETKLNIGLRDSNYDQLYAYLKQQEAHANENKMMLDRFTQHTVDPLALMSNVSTQQQYPLSSTTPPSTYLQPHSVNTTQLDSGGQATAVDKDVDAKHVQDLALNVDNVFQADDCDAFDSDVDEAPTIHTMFMANLSSADPVYDKDGPSYDSDILSEVHDHDHYQDAVCEHHEVHEMHDDVQPNYVVDLHADYTTNSNMILYDQNNREVHLDYLKHLKESVETLREIVEEVKATTPLTRKKQVTFVDQGETSNYNTHKHVEQLTTQKSYVPIIPSTGVNSCTDASESKTRSNTKKNKISLVTSVNRKTVEDHPRSNKSNLQKPNRVESSISSKRTVINSNSDSVCKTCNKCFISANHDICVIKYLNDVNASSSVKNIMRKVKRVWKPKPVKQVWKATGKVRTNVGYQWKPTGRILTLGEKCPLTRFTQTKVMPAKQPENETDTQEQDKNKAKNDKTEHEMEKIEKDKVIRSRKVKSQSPKSIKVNPWNVKVNLGNVKVNPDKAKAEK
nr:hypothetical protein [Tanacetum cinerariifolium]